MLYTVYRQYRFTLSTFVSCLRSSCSSMSMVLGGAWNSWKLPCSLQVVGILISAHITVSLKLSEYLPRICQTLEERIVRNLRLLWYWWIVGIVARGGDSTRCTPCCIKKVTVKVQICCSKVPAIGTLNFYLAIVFMVWMCNENFSISKTGRHALFIFKSSQLWQHRSRFRFSAEKIMLK